MHNWPVPTRLLFCASVALVLGAGMGALYHLANPDKPLLLSLAIFVIATGVVPAVATYWMLWPSERLLAEQRQAEHSVERRWMVEASSNAFWWLAAGLIWCEVYGDLMNVAWLSPVTLIHILVVAGLAYGVSYLTARFRRA